MEVPQTLEQVDTLLSQIESPQSEAPEQVESQPEAPQTPQEAQAELEFELERKGTRKKFPQSKVIDFAQQGWDYSENMRTLNQTKSQFETERKSWEEQKQQWEQISNTYRPVDEYMKANPDFWEHVQRSYQERLGTNNAAEQPIIKALQAELAEMKPIVSSIVEERKIAQIKQADNSLNAAITEYREKHSDFDWDSLDQNNQTLEQRILDHSQKHYIGSFRAAANDLLMDELVKKASLRSKEEIGKTIQKSTKLGLGPVTKTPTDKLSRAKNVQNRSYDDLAEEALREYGVS